MVLKLSLLMKHSSNYILVYCLQLNIILSKLIPKYLNLGVSRKLYKNNICNLTYLSLYLCIPWYNSLCWRPSLWSYVFWLFHVYTYALVLLLLLCYCYFCVICALIPLLFSPTTSLNILYLLQYVICHCTSPIFTCNLRNILHYTPFFMHWLMGNICLVLC